MTRFHFIPFQERMRFDCGCEEWEVDQRRKLIPPPSARTVSKLPPLPARQRRVCVCALAGPSATTTLLLLWTDLEFVSIVALKSEGNCSEIDPFSVAALSFAKRPLNLITPSPV